MKACKTWKMWVVVLAVVAVASGGKAFATSALEPVGWGQHAYARGGADVAIGESAVGLNLNPANLYNAAKRLDVSVHALNLVIHWRETSVPLQPKSIRSGYRWVALPDAGIAVPVNDRLTLGLSANGHAAIMSRWGSGRKAWFLLPKVNLGACYKLTDNFAIGASGAIARADLQLKFQDIGLETGRMHGEGFGWTVGARWDVTETVSLGASYMSKLHFSQLDSHKAHIDHFDFPDQFAIGAAFKVTDKLTIAPEFRYVRYRQSDFNKTNIYDEENRMLWRLDPNYRSQPIFILGAQYKINDNWVFAVGHQYARNVQQDHDAFFLIPAIVEHTTTLGLRWEGKRLEVGFAFI